MLRRLSLVSVLLLIYLLFSGAMVYAQDPKEPAGLPALQKLIENLITFSVAVAFIVLTVMLFIGGVKYLTSGGEQKEIQSAHQTMTWALLGIVILILGWIFIQLVANFSGADVTKFGLDYFMKPE